MNPKSVDGILLLNKASGLTSNKALQQVKRLLQAKKAGHTGSLDPLATGMLPLCFGEATKVCQYLLDADKTYRAKALFGIKTNTADSMGEVIAQNETVNVTNEQLLQALKQFTGKISQIPSMFSALKHKGQPLYKYARKGQEIERAPREVSIRQLNLLAFDGQTFQIEVSCSKGTYIRNLVEDIANSLGLYAHLTALHRVHTAGFQGATMYTFEELSLVSMQALQDCLLPLDQAIAYLPSQRLTDAEALLIRQGQSLVDVNFLSATLLRLYHDNGRFLGIGETDGNRIKAKRLLSFC